MNVGEFGNVFRFNAGTDISSTTPTLILEPRFGTCLRRTTEDGVTVPSVDFDAGNTTFLANEYVAYTIQEDDIAIAGRWRAKLEADFTPTKKLITDYQRFTVMP